MPGQVYPLLAPAFRLPHVWSGETARAERSETASTGVVVGMAVAVRAPRAVRRRMASILAGLGGDSAGEDEEPWSACQPLS